MAQARLATIRVAGAAPGRRNLLWRESLRFAAVAPQRFEPLPVG